MKIKSIKTTAFRSELKEPTRDETSYLILGNALILLRGRSTLRVRKALTLNKLISSSSIIPVKTTIKSSEFHASRR